MNVPAMLSKDLLEGDPAPLQLEDQEIMLVRFEGKPYALSNVCTHSYALLTDGWFEDGCIECPLHQACFDIKSGEPTCGPASVPVKTYAVTERDEQVWIDLSAVA